MISDHQELHELTQTLLTELFPICRSITGNGVRESFSILKKYADFQVHEYPSGTECYDWTVPREWNIKNAWIKDRDGNLVVSFEQNNLHVLNYSVAVSGKFSFAELLPHLYTLPEMPDAIPYRTTYYEQKWGFCLEHERLQRMDPEGVYEVLIDSTLEDGSLTLVDAVIKGESDEEILISAYSCHPSMGNDNLSGMVMATLLYRYLCGRKNRFTYRFVICPETIGAVCYLKHHEQQMKKVAGCFVLTCVAGRGELGYKETFLGDHLLDRASRLALEEMGGGYKSYPFVPNGSDERQYSSVGFRIPTVLITKDKYYDYDCYHTSKDNLDFVSTQNLLKTYAAYKKALCCLENDVIVESLNPMCEVRLGKRGLYPNTGGIITDDPEGVGSKRFRKPELCRDETDLSLWIMFLADGKNSVLDISERTGADFELVLSKVESFKEHGLLKTYNGGMRWTR